MQQLSAPVRTLENIGFNEKEATIYITLLSLETATAYQIAQHCEVKKPTVYVILEDLRKKGLVLKVPHAKRALFSAVDIEEFLHEKERGLASVRAELPKFRSLGNTPPAGVYFFNGARGIAQAIDFKFDSMRGKTFCTFYGNLTGSPEEVLRIYREWDKKALGANIAFNIIMGKNDRGPYYQDLVDLSKKSEYVEIRYREDFKYPSNASIGISENFVWIVDEKNLQATVIDNKSTAQAFRQIFDAVWEKGV